MKTSVVTTEDLARSVIAVPPLARRSDMSLDPGENRRLAEHLGRGGVSTLLYGGNANLYNVGVSDYGALLDLLEEIAPNDAWVIPSIGADFGKALDQVAILRDRAFPAAMVLPLASPLTTPGVAGGLRRLADHFGRPLIVYVKAEGYLAPGEVAALVKDGVACAVKYAIVRRDPKDDAFLAELVQKAGTARIVSGIGERPAIDHLTVFGLTGFTSGSVCVAPALSSAILAALKTSDLATASRLRALFLPLEDLRDLHSPIRVLHEAVRLAGVAETGPLVPVPVQHRGPGGARLDRRRGARAVHQEPGLRRAQRRAIGAGGADPTALQLSFRQLFSDATAPSGRRRPLACCRGQLTGPIECTTNIFLISKPRPADGSHQPPPERFRL